MVPLPNQPRFFAIAEVSRIVLAKPSVYVIILDDVVPIVPAYLSCFADLLAN